MHFHNNDSSKTSDSDMVPWEKIMMTESTYGRGKPRMEASRIDIVKKGGRKGKKYSYSKNAIGTPAIGKAEWNMFKTRA
jgi:hypothetical protein